MPNQALELEVRARTRQAEAALKRMQTTGRAAFQWTRNLRAGLMGMNNMMMGAGAAMVATGVAARSAIRSSEDYSNAQANLRSVLVSSNVSVREQQNLMRVADVQATRYGMGMADTSRAMVDLAEAGFNTHEVMRLFPIAAEFATAGNLELRDAVDMLQVSMHQFNLQSEDEARQMAGGLVVAARISSTSVEELQNAFRYAGVEASGMGYSAQEVTAALAGLSGVGLRGSIAGTRLRAVLSSLNRVARNTAEFAQDMGIREEEITGILYDETGAVRPLREAMQGMADLFGRLGTAQDQQMLSWRLFGRYGQSAGQVFAQLHQGGMAWTQILDQISDQEYINTTVSQAAEENMRGFGAQMRLARVAAENFGIAFGEIFLGADAAREGFGRYLADLSDATRLADASSRTNGVARERWEALTPAMREQGSEMRETLKALAEMIKLGGAVAGWILRWSARNPRLAGSLLLVGSALRPLVATGGGMGLLRLLGSGLRQVGGLFNWVAASSGALGTVLNSLSGATAVLAGMTLGYHLSDWTTGLYDFLRPAYRMTDWLQLYKQRAEEGRASWLRYVPVLQGAVFLVRMFGIMVADAWRAITGSNAITSTSEAGGHRGLQASNALVAQDLINDRARGMNQESRYAGMSGTERTFIARTQLITEAVQEAAALARTSGMSNRDALNNFQEQMRTAGLNADQMNNVMGLYRNALQRNMETQRALASGLNTNFNEASRSVASFAVALGNLDLPSNPIDPEMFGGGVPEVQDAYVRRGGIVAAASDDLIVNRRRLAQVISMGPGDAIPSPVIQQVGAMPQGQHPASSETTVRFEIPLYLDGREIARAVGTQTLQSDQRRGVRTEGGSRRRVAQSGAR